MTEQAIFYLLLVIISFDFVLERTLSFLNRKSAKQPIPKELGGIYDDEKYARSQAYQTENSRFATLTASFSVIALFCAIS
ncbi:MAG: M48 family peptidase, partial [Bacteroidota bacterium]